MKTDIQEKLKRFSKDYGIGDEQITHWVYNHDYPTFKLKMSSYFVAKSETGKLDKEEEHALNLHYNEEMFLNMKKRLNETITAFDDLDNNKDYKFPYREIANGNFPMFDKSKLTNELRVQLNVHGLLDEEFDIYVDVEHNVMIPIYYDFSTTNLKWFEFKDYLRKLYDAINIKGNWKIPLLLLDRDLMGIDCFKETYSDELNNKIATECERNIFFAMRECAAFKDSDGNKMKTEISIGDWTWLWLYAQCFNTYREAPRQTGKTFFKTLTQGVEYGIASSGMLSLIVHFKSSNAKKNRNMMLESANNLPRYLRTHTIKEKIKKGKKEHYVLEEEALRNTEISKNIWKNNILKTVAVGKTESTAEQAGRGDTARIVDIDELNYITQVEAVLTAVTWAHSTAKIKALKEGKRYGMHFTSTAGKLNTKHGRAMYDLIHNRMCKFEPILFSYNFKDLEVFLKLNSKTSFFVIKYDYDELGYDENWFDLKILESRNNEEIQVDILQEWMNTDGTSIFKLDHIIRLQNLSKKKFEKIYAYKKNNIIKYYPNTDISFEDMIKNVHAMGWGVDPSSGGGDFSVIFAYNLITLEPLFTFKTNNMVITDFTNLVMDLMRHVKKIQRGLKLIVNPEQNGPGLAMIPLLIREKDIEPHIFKTLIPYDARKKTQVINGWNRVLNNDYYLSYGTNMVKTTHTGVRVRDALFETHLFELIDKHPNCVSFPDVANEIFSLGRTGGRVDGKIQAKPGFHDDVVCAVLHAYFMVLDEHNRYLLSRFFNFTVDPTKIVNESLFTNESNDELVSLDDKIDYEIEKVLHYTGNTFERIKLFRYVNGTRILIEDMNEVLQIVNASKDLTSVFNSLQKLPVEDIKKLVKASENLNSTRNTYRTEDRTSYIYKENNKHVVGAKMF